MGRRLLLSLAAALFAVAIMSASSSAATDRGNAPPKLSFFSGGDEGANAHWQHDEADSPDDDNEQDIEVNTLTSPNGYAGFDVHHVFGTPTEQYPPSSYDLKSNAPSGTPSLGSPRLVVVFSDGGNASLRPLTLETEWQTVSDNNWDNNSGGCGFRFQQTWQQIQACHPGTTIVEVFFTADPYGWTHWVDNVDTAGKVWNEAADNGNNSSE